MTNEDDGGLELTILGNTKNVACTALNQPSRLLNSSMESVPTVCAAVEHRCLVGDARVGAGAELRDGVGHL